MPVFLPIEVEATDDQDNAVVDAKIYLEWTCTVHSNNIFKILKTIK